MSNSKPSALVVDDERINLLIFNKMLVSFGVESANATNGYECVELCSKRRFDYIFLDIRMPGMDGFDTLKELNKLCSGNFDVPVICITGDTDNGRKKEILASGFTDLMSKPINKKVLEDMLKKYAHPGVNIFSVTDEDEDEDEDAEERLPDWVGSIPELDAEYGVMHCGSVTDFLNALRIFNDSINDRSYLIDKYIKQGNLEDLKLTVHSLKSTAGAIGAKQLAEMSKLLEKACEEHNTPFIYNLTPEYLNKYRAIGDHIRKYWKGPDGEENLRYITENELMDAYNTIEELMGRYDLGNIDKILKTLEKCEMSDEWRELFNDLNIYLRRMDWEKAREIMEDFKKRGGK